MSKQIEIPLLDNLLRTGRAFATRETVTYPDGTRVEREIVVPEQRRAVTPAVWQPTSAQVQWYRAARNGLVCGEGGEPFTQPERDLYYRIQDWDQGRPDFSCPAPCIGSRDRRHG